MLKAVHASEDLPAARAKVLLIVAKLHKLKLPAAAAPVQDHRRDHQLLCLPFRALEHSRSLRQPIERIMREIRRTRDAFPYGHYPLRQLRSAPGQRPPLVARRGAPNAIWTWAVCACPPQRITPRPHNSIRWADTTRELADYKNVALEETLGLRPQLRHRLTRRPFMNPT